MSDVEKLIMIALVLIIGFGLVFLLTTEIAKGIAVGFMIGSIISILREE